MRQIRPCYSSEHQVRRHMHRYRVRIAHFTSTASHIPHLEHMHNYLHHITTDIHTRRPCERKQQAFPQNMVQ